MAREYNFGVKLGLNSAQFKKGVAEVRASINGLWASFKGFSAALGAGLGFGMIVAQIKDTVKEISVAEATLKNVSHNTFEGLSKASEEYSDNIGYLTKMSKDLSQNYVALVNNFAQFRASCQNTNLTLEEQKNIFEALTQAATYYHMSADRTNNMMIAITQMMSKGKVSAEELRRQLGNALPGAFNMMAEAIGVTTAKMESMMKKGEVISEDALPKFAALLKSTTRLTEDSFNSVQLKMNDISNAWIKFVQNGKFEGIYTKLLDKVAKALNSIAMNFGRFKGNLMSLVMSIGSMKIFEGLIKQGNQWVANMQANNKKVINNHKETIKGLQRENKTLESSIASLGSKNTAIMGKISSTVEDKNFITPGQLTQVTPGANGYYDLSEFKQSRYSASEYAKITALAKQYNENLAKSLQLQGESRDKIQQIRLIQGQITEIEDKNNKKINTWGLLTRGVGQIFKNIWTVLKGNIYAILAGAILGIITKIVTKEAEWHKKLKEIGGILNDQQDAYKKVQNNITEQEETIKKHLRTLRDQNKSIDEQQIALHEINNIMGLVGDSALKIEDGYDKIADATSTWMTKLRRVAQMQQLIGQQAENNNKINSNNIDAQTLFTQWKQKNHVTDVSFNDVFDTSTGEIKKSNTLTGRWINQSRLRDIKGLLLENKALEESNKKLASQADELSSTIAEETGKAEKKVFDELLSKSKNKKLTSSDVESYLSEYGYLNNKHTEQAKIWQRQFKIAEEGGDGGNSKDPITKLEASLTSLEEQHKKNLIDDAEYNKKVADEIADAIDEKLKKEPKWLDTSAGNKYSSMLKDYQEKVKEDADEKSSANKLKKANQTIENAYTELLTKIGNINNHESLYGFKYTDEEIKEKTNDAYTDFLESLENIDVEGIKGIDKLRDYIKEKFPQVYDELKTADGIITKAMQDKFDEMLDELEKPSIPQSRDKFFDYKMDKKDIATDNRKNAVEYAKEVQKYINGAMKAEKGTNGIALGSDKIAEIKQYLQNAADLTENDALSNLVKDSTIQNLQDALDLIKRIMKETDNLETKAKLAELDDDITKFSNDLYKGVYTGVKDIATSVDRLNNAVQTLADAFDFEIDEDTLEQWEQLEAVFNLITQSIDSICSMINTFKEVAEIFDKLNRAQDKKNALTALGDTETITQSTSALVANTTAKNANTDAAEANAIATTLEATTAEGAIGAKLGEAGANTTDAVTANADAAAHSKSAIAKIADAFAANPIAGIAILASVGAGIAGIVAMLKSAGAFAKGGVVGGNSKSGDKLLARVNSGEGILTAEGVKNLSTLYNNQGRLGDVQFKIRGTDLIGVMKNTQSRIKG